MGLREEIFGKVEEKLNESVDKISAESLKKEADKLVEKLREELYKFIDEKVDGFKHKLKADIIDKLDGEDDIK